MTKYVLSSKLNAKFILKKKFNFFYNCKFWTVFLVTQIELLLFYFDFMYLNLKANKMMHCHCLPCKNLFLYLFYNHGRSVRLGLLELSYRF